MEAGKAQAKLEKERLQAVSFFKPRAVPAITARPSATNQNNQTVESSQPHLTTRGSMGRQTPNQQTELQVPTSRATSPPLSEFVFIINIRFLKMFILLHRQKDTR